MTRPLHLAFVTAVAALTGACNGMDMGNMDGTMIPEVIEVDASEGPFEPNAAPDLDPAPNVVEVALEAKVADVEIAPGRTASMWTYNGQLPGPRIEARAGDTVRVRFKNSLPEATTIHWHGVRVPAAMDGVPAVQSPIAAGVEFTYEFVVPDAGTFWYHPHVRSEEQVERGLYGAFVVRGDAEPATTTDRTVVLDDLLVDSNWQLSDFDPMMQAMVGRQGNVILANGWAHPIAGVARGGLHRFRFINAANARYFRLALPGHRTDSDRHGRRPPSRATRGRRATPRSRRTRGCARRGIRRRERNDGMDVAALRPRARNRRASRCNRVPDEAWQRRTDRYPSNPFGVCGDR
jgi:FtsP/CotA-like multicopper oxidase with cupredoxin domain